MSVKRFKFVSPGVFINEIDNSQLPKEPEAVGPCVIGRFEKGPAMRPVRVSSMAEFVEIFGNPIPGTTAGDVWREGNFTAPTYAAYAALAYLRNSGPITVVRVLGEAHPSATATGVAGWKTSATYGDDRTPSDNGGAYGLFLFTSGSTQIDRVGQILGSPRGGSTGGGAKRGSKAMTGSLAAVWYFDEGAIELSGALDTNLQIQPVNADEARTFGQTAFAANALALRSSNVNTMEFTTVLFDQSNVGKKVTFNFDRNSENYIRKVFNTNPTLLGHSSTVSTKKGYFLGETFDRHLRDMHGSTLNEGSLAADASLKGVILGLKSRAGNNDWATNSISTQHARSGWIFGQDLTTNYGKFDGSKQQKLFRFASLDDGDWSSRNIKVSITELRNPSDADPYGSFSVQFRSVRDSDNRPIILERFSNCNLNPNSANYIARKIGDQYQEWDAGQNRYRVYGGNPNNSRYLRVIMNEDVDEGISDPAYIPFGFYGPPRYKTTVLSSYQTGLYSGSSWHPAEAAARENSTTEDVEDNLVTGSNKVVYAISGNAGTGAGNTGHHVLSSSTNVEGGVPLKFNGIFNTFVTGTVNAIAGFNQGVSASIVFPSLPLRVSSSDGGVQDEKKAFFGISTTRGPESTRFDESYLDVVGGGQGMAADTYDTAANTEHSFIFTLDDVVAANSHPNSVSTAHYCSGSRKLGASYTALRSGWGSGSLVDSGFGNFTLPLYGGFNGINIKEREPLGHHAGALNPSSLKWKDSYAAHSVKRAIDSAADPEVVEINMMAAPGIRAPLITNHMINVCEDRADALAVVDIERAGYIPSTDTTKSFKTRISNSSVVECVALLKQRGINSSYACTYFPWVKIYDEINDAQVWVPPSVVALGTFASTERNSELWFAPAGFTRGGLSEGSAGLPVVGVSQRLTSKDRDMLYENNINPIATFPAEGIVIFGQKTLQTTRSALDRINVRRLMIFVKKEVSRMASRLLFDQNVQSTWNRFRGQVEPFLDSVKARLGLTDFKVVLDETTTTPDLVDRNIMYAKIFLKPARSIEFIAIDFVITNTGASFED